MTEEDLQTSKPDLFGVIPRSDITTLRNILSLDGVDIEARDTSGRTPLHLAVIAGSSDICQCLLEHGANVAAWTGQGESTVHLAARRGDVDIVHTIMKPIQAKEESIQNDANAEEHKVDVNCFTQKYKMSPLYIAVALGA
jgi:ankyrin repeat protein